LPLEWTTADYALIVSLVSLCFAVASFAWNVWSKFIFPKPKLQVLTNVTILVGVEPPGPLVWSVKVVNHGPGDVLLEGIVGNMRKPTPWARRQRALMKCYLNWPHSMSLSAIGELPNIPRKLTTGESHTVFFPLEIFADSSINDVVALDSFGREHRAGGIPKAVRNRRARKATSDPKS
jgi:hypothetical protein